MCARYSLLFAGWLALPAIAWAQANGPLPIWYPFTSALTYPAWPVQYAQYLPPPAGAIMPGAAVEQTPEAEAPHCCSGPSAGGLFGSVGGALDAPRAVNPDSTSGGALSATQLAAPAVASIAVGGGEAFSRAASDPAELLGKTMSAPGVWIHHLSPVASEPIIRGYRLGQIYTQVDGGLMLPVRQDLDAALSRIGALQIENVVVIKGPYSVRYGPGFSFIDVETLDTPRYENGWQTHGSTYFNYQTNGQQWQPFQTVYGGNDKMGFRFGYDLGVGNDYTAGNGLEQLSSYNVQNFTGGLGYSFNDTSRLEVKYIHQQDHPLELPGTIYNISNLISDAVSGRLVWEEPERYRLVLESWFNYARYRGNDLDPAKRAAIDQLTNFRNAFGPLDFTTEGDLGVWGGRGMWTWGAGSSAELTVGADCRIVNQHQNNIASFPLAAFGNLALPRSHSIDPGVFVDAAFRLTDRLTVKTGGRVDWVTAEIENFDTPQPGGNNLVGPNVFDFFPLTDYNNQYTVWTAFVTPEYQLSDRWTLFGGYGVGQRPPTLAELYSMASFNAMIQQPLTLQVGNPLLSAERGQQLDLGFRYDSPQFRGGANGYVSWIRNYITYEQFLLQNNTPGPFPDGVPVYYALNADLVRLAGFELYGEWDATRWLTPFATMSFVRADNLSRNTGFSPGSPQVGLGGSVSPAPGTPDEPMYGIPPLDSRVGVRLHDPDKSRWGIELSAHLVDSQNQVATTLFEQPTPGYTIYDARGYWRPSDKLLLTAGIENFTDKTYFEAQDSRTFNSAGARTGAFQPGFNAYVGAQISY